MGHGATKIQVPTKLINVVAVHTARSMQGRHSGKPTAPLGQCARFMTIQAVVTALVRSHVVLKSLCLSTLAEHAGRLAGSLALPDDWLTIRVNN